MSKLWIDIEELNNKFHIGYLIEEKNLISGYEHEITKIDDIIEIIKFHNVDEILYFDGNEGNYVFARLVSNINEHKSFFANKQVKITNVGSDYKRYLSGSKLQMTKNSDVAKAFGINLRYSGLHQPLYDIQLTYCSYHNFKIDNEETRKNKIYDSFFVLTNKFDILWKVLNKFNVPKEFVNVKVIKPNDVKNVLFVDLKDVTYKDKLIEFTNIKDLSDIKKIDITVENIPEIIKMFENNFIVFTDAKKQSELSRMLWEIQYMDFATKRLTRESFMLKKDLYIFMSINISRFKLAINDFNFKSIKEKIGQELDIDNLKRINK